MLVKGVGQFFTVTDWIGGVETATGIPVIPLKTVMNDQRVRFCLEYCSTFTTHIDSLSSPS